MFKLNKTTKSALIIIIFTLGSKLLGFIRRNPDCSKIWFRYGNRYIFVALTATNLVVIFLSEAISTTFIPILSEIEIKEGKKVKLNIRII